MRLREIMEFCGRECETVEDYERECDMLGDCGGQFETEVDVRCRERQWEIVGDCEIVEECGRFLEIGRYCGDRGRFCETGRLRETVGTVIVGNCE